jgi:hypothetical protein
MWPVADCDDDDDVCVCVCVCRSPTWLPRRNVDVQATVSTDEKIPRASIRVAVVLGIVIAHPGCVNFLPRSRGRVGPGTRSRRTRCRRGERGRLSRGWRSEAAAQRHACCFTPARAVGVGGGGNVSMKASISTLAKQDWPKKKHSRATTVQARARASYSHGVEL